LSPIDETMPRPLTTTRFMACSMAASCRPLRPA
jgi:hypothetical protein